MGTAALTPATARALTYTRRAVAVAVAGVVAVVALVFLRPETQATNVQAGAVAVDPPTPFVPDPVAADPGRMKAPVVGFYPIQLNTTIAGEAAGGTTTASRRAALQADSVGNAPSDGGTYVTITTSGAQARNVVVFRDGGAFIAARESLEGCVFPEPIKRWADPLAVGLQWTASGSCKGQAGGGRRGPGGGGRGASRDSSIELESRVIGTKTVSVAGVRVATFVIETAMTTTDKFAAANNEQVVTRVEREVQLFAPSLGLPVQIRSNIGTLTRAGTTETQVDSTLELTMLSTTPSATR